jgi:hypothetical protein
LDIAENERLLIWRERNVINEEPRLSMHED